MTRYQRNVAAILSFFVGVAAGSVLTGWHAFLSGLGWFTVLLIFWGVRYKYIPGKILLLVLLAFLIGWWRIQVTFPVFDTGHIGFYTDMAQDVTLEGEIVSDPEFRNNAQYFVVEAERLRVGGRDGGDDFVQEVGGRLLVKTYPYPVYGYGDAVVVRGQLQRPPEFDTFSYAQYLAKDDIYAVMYRARINLVASAEFSLSIFFESVVGAKRQSITTSLFGQLLTLKHGIKHKIELLFPEPDASIVLGLLLGMRASIPQHLLDAFQQSGLTHILAISGYNITLLITVFGTLLIRFSRRTRFIATCLAITVFAVLTGLSASVVRASIMGALMVFMLFQGQKTQGMLLLLWSGVFMVLVSPRILIWDVSFQLSFVSTLGLMVLMPKWEHWVKKLPPLLGEGLVVTLAATVFTMPVVLYHFGSFSLISPLANIIFLPFIPLIMMSSFLALVSSFLLLPTTVLFIGITWGLVKIFLEGVVLVAAIPFAFMTDIPFPLWAGVVYYFLVWLSL